jgi:hypothetical protein
MKAGGNWSPRIQERGAKGTKAGSADFELFTTVPVPILLRYQRFQRWQLSLVLFFHHSLWAKGRSARRNCREGPAASDSLSFSKENKGSCWDVCGVSTWWI